MSWIQSFCAYQALRFMVVVTSLPMVICGSGVSTLVLAYPHIAAGSLLIGTSGVFFTTVGLIGTLAAIKKSKYATLSYGITLLLLCGIEVLLGGLFYLYLDQVRDFVESDLSQGQRRTSKPDRKAWARVERQFKCCLESDIAPKMSCSTDCISALRHEFNSFMPSIGTIAILVFFFQLVSACCALSYYNFYVPSSEYKPRVQYLDRPRLPRLDRRC